MVCLSCHNEPKNTKLRGVVFGTSYAIIYDSDINYQRQCDSLFNVINNSMSTYQEDSDISKFNRNELSDVDSHFVKVYRHKHTIQKTNPNVYLEFNAIAKGYAVDVIGAFLEANKIENYLVEIGGEIRVKGSNSEKQKSWEVGLEEPNFDGEQVILKAIKLKDQAMATSGTYRKFKIDNQGKRYAHIIDTDTGYPSKTNLLSITVIAEDCITADAYATAFKSMGIKKVKAFLQHHPELKVFLIFENEKQELETLSLNGFPE